MSYKQLQILFFLGFLIFVFVINSLIFLPFLGSLLLALIFAIIFKPLHARFEKLMPNYVSLTALLTILVALIVAFTPLIFLGLEIFNETSQLYTSLTRGEEVINMGASIGFVSEQFLQNIGLPPANISGERLSFNINQYLEQIVQWIFTNVGTIFSSVAQVAFSLLLSLFALYYLLKDGHKLKKAIIAISPLSDHYDQEIFEKLSRVVSSVVKGMLVVAVLQGILAGIGFWVFGIPHPALWGSVTAIASLLPIVGTAVITMPAIIYLFFTGSSASAIGLLIWSMILVGTLDNFLRPKLMERDMALHPFLILLSVLGGVRIFGPVGFLLGPLLLSLFFALISIYQREFREYVGQ